MSWLSEYRPLALAIAREYWLPGCEFQDVRQEAMIGLWHAARDYRPELGAFAPFARLCIHRHLTTCLKKATRLKHLPLNESVEIDPGSRSVLMHGLDPSEILETKEQALELLRRVREDLSAIERRCLIGVANGMTHKEIWEEVGGSETQGGEGGKRYRRVDNAMMRAKHKLAA